MSFGKSGIFKNIYEGVNPTVTVNYGMPKCICHNVILHCFWDECRKSHSRKGDLYTFYIIGTVFLMSYFLYRFSTMNPHGELQKKFPLLRWYDCPRSGVQTISDFKDFVFMGLDFIGISHMKEAMCDAMKISYTFSKSFLLQGVIFEFFFLLSWIS